MDTPEVPHYKRRRITGQRGKSYSASRHPPQHGNQNDKITAADGWQLIGRRRATSEKPLRSDTSIGVRKTRPRRETSGRSNIGRAALEAGRNHNRDRAGIGNGG